MYLCVEKKIDKKKEKKNDTKPVSIFAQTNTMISPTSIATTTITTEKKKVFFLYYSIHYTYMRETTSKMNKVFFSGD